jgi:hypothetical protein
VICALRSLLVGECCTLVIWTPHSSMQLMMSRLEQVTAALGNRVIPSADLYVLVFLLLN